MTDKELIEQAAKAAGISKQWDGSLVDQQNPSGVWNPLEDDGDALRLAVKLHISVSWSPSGRSVKASVSDNPFLVFGMDSTDDAYADARRAIVLAAAGCSV